MQADLSLLFGLLDKSVHAVETGSVPKSDISVALEAMFKVGESGGKSRERFDALMQALDADQDGPIITYKSLFEEDREYNQGDRPCMSQFMWMYKKRYVWWKDELSFPIPCRDRHVFIPAMARDPQLDVIYLGRLNEAVTKMRIFV